MGRKNKHNRRYTPPAGAKVTQLDPNKLMAQMNTSSLGPGTPIQPAAGVTLPDGPRLWQYPVGYNITTQPRSTEENSFATLRSLASLFDGFLLCEQVWFDYTSKLELEIKPKQRILEAAGGDASVFAQDIAQYKEFFEYPDIKNGRDLKSWMRAAVRDQLELDAVAIYVRRNRGGGVYSLELVDGATIVPKLDIYGGRPLPPQPAYQQVWEGIPMGWYTTEDMLYVRETERTDSVYGLARIERIIMRVNQALRKQNKDMALYTEGNLPAGILEVPPVDGQEWTPESLIAFQTMWDGMLAGNDKTRNRVKLSPPGSKFTPIEEQAIQTAFDTFLLNITVASMGLTMAELGFTENVNKSSGDSQEAVTYRRAMRPLMNRYAELFTYILSKYFGENRFVVCWRGYEEAEDLLAQSQAYSNLIKVGVISPSRVARILNLPVDQEIPEYFASGSGPIFFNQLLDPQLLAAQKQAKLTGLSQSEQPNDEEEDDNEDEGDEEKPDGDNVERQKALSTEYRRWKDVAIKDVRSGKPVRTFTTTVIPQEEYNRVSTLLQSCNSVEQVKDIFRMK